MIIPHTQLSPEALQAIIEEFITREGTIYGEYDYSMDEMVTQVIAQLTEGSVHISFDEESGTCSLSA